MPNKNRYFIEYRMCGKFRLQIIHLREKLNTLFPELYHKGDRFVAHLTVIPPIKGEIHRNTVLNTVRDACADKKLVEFKLAGYGYFDNEEKVIFAKIAPSKEFLEIRNSILQNLRKRTELSNEYEKTEGFNPHVTLGWTKNKKNAEKIIKYLNSNHPIDANQILDRITILNGSRILWEYDLFNKRVLERREALRHGRRLENIRRIILLKGERTEKKSEKEESPPSTEPAQKVKRGLWAALKEFFGGKSV